jgi:Fe2+ transport system protein B
MKNLTKILTLTCFSTIIAWCNTPFWEVKTPIDDLVRTPEYQQAKQQIDSWVEYLWNKTNEFIENNEWAQLIRDKANEKINLVTEEAKRQYENAKETAKDLSEKAQEEAKRQYKEAKEAAKTSVKEALNKKVDEAFDKI